MEIELITVIAAILQVCVGGRRSFAPSSVRKMIQHLNGAAARMEATSISAKMQPHFSTLTRCGCIEFVPTVQLRNRPRRITNRDRLQDLIDNPARISEFLPDDIEVVPEAADLIEHVLVPEGTEQPYREEAILDVRRELLEAFEEHENSLLEMMSDSNQKLFDKLHVIEQQISSLRELLDQTCPRSNEENLRDNADTVGVSLAVEPEALTPKRAAPAVVCDPSADIPIAGMTGAEEMPLWLRLWKPSRQTSLPDFFGSRVVYYPGSGTDGQPVEFFGSRHAAHCFVFVDYGIPRSIVERELNEHPFEGYRSIGRRALDMHDLTPNGWMPSIKPEVASAALQATVPPYAFLEILERQHDFDDAHGPQRLAILILCADGVAAYDSLFCQATVAAPFAVVLQDHGWGGNWTTFGHGGALENLALFARRLPQFLFVAENTIAWTGYEEVDGAILGRGGMHRFERQLWRRSDQDGGASIAPKLSSAEAREGTSVEVIDDQPSPLPVREESEPPAEDAPSDGTATGKVRDKLLQNQILEKLQSLRDALRQHPGFQGLNVGEPDLLVPLDPCILVTGFEPSSVQLQIKMQLTGKTVVLNLLPSNRLRLAEFEAALEAAANPFEVKNGNVRFGGKYTQTHDFITREGGYPRGIPRDDVDTIVGYSRDAIERLTA